MGMRYQALVVAIVVALGGGAPVTAADDAARETLVRLREDLRAPKSLRVTSTLRIRVGEGDAAADGDPVKAEFLWRRDGTGQVRIREYTCVFGDGRFRAVHDANPDAYYETTYEGSPYWVLWDVFRDLPYPHVALLWGEPATNDVLMQLHPRTPLLQPLRVEQRPSGDVQHTVLTLEGKNGTLELVSGPRPMRLVKATHTLDGGPHVQPGVTIRTSYTFKYVPVDAEDPAPSIDLAGRQKTVEFASLAPRPEIADAPPIGGGMPQPGGLVGAPAPEFVLATLDGGAIDLNELRGHVVVLDFWATWCGPCKRALPALHEVAQWADDAGHPATVLAVNTFERNNPAANTPDKQLALVKSFWNEAGYTLPVLLDYTDATALSFGVQGIPATVVIRSDGVVHAQHTGFTPDYVQQLRDDIEAALRME